jgi:hypothetical protein
VLTILFTETVTASESTNSGAADSGAVVSTPVGPMSGKSYVNYGIIGASSIKKCIDLVESIEDLSDQEKADGARLMKSEVNREIFLNFTSPRVRLLWIKGEIAKQVS